MKKRPDGATIEPLLFRQQAQPLGREGAQPKNVLAMPAFLLLLRFIARA